MNNIGIDIGGTFTDCYVRYKDSNVTTKTPTTTYDLSIGLVRSIEDAAKVIGISVEELLKETEFIFYSTTVAMNTLIQRKGPRLCLITTRGFEDTILRGRGTQWQDGLTIKEKKCIPVMSKPEPLIPRELIVGVRERVDQMGKVVLPLDETEFREQLRYLVDKGVRGFAVCLLFAHLNDLHERRLREIIEEEYPDYCLGGMPVVLSSEVLPKQGEYGRTMSTILNAYLQQAMSEQLSHVTDQLRSRGYEKSLKIIHNTGGVGELFTTMAIQTYNGGPVAGLIGGAYISSKLYGAKNSLVTDMGGTSFDMGVIVEGNPRFYTFWPVMDKWLTGITTLESRSIGAGGGSIAWVNEIFRRLEVGPQSAGAMPGPACYDQGGEEPTVTDADVVLGYINPDFFHGGKLKLNKAKASKSIKKIAQYFQLDIEETALMIKKIIDANMGNNLYKETVLRGFDPREFLLFAFGGAGPTHCCGYNQAIGVEKIIVFPYSPVFCAFGSTVMDMRRIYEQAKYMILSQPLTTRLVAEPEEFNSVVRGIQNKAMRDLVADRVNPMDAIYSLELDMKFGGHIHTLRCHSPRVFLRDEGDVKMLYEAFMKEYSEVFSPMALLPRSGVVITNFTLHCVVPQVKPEFAKFRKVGSSSKKAFVTKRPVWWEYSGTFKDTATYNMDRLECGNIVEGPAIVEAPDTTVVIYPGYRYKIDEYLNGIIERT
ncbi:MAG: hydantoinase/oxoprolinase family protein [Thermodesulfobacteriota bacterium]|jgi:N-methylhydantoinase A/acetophenone carboxylase